MEASQQDNPSLQPHLLLQNKTASLQSTDPDLFAFLKTIQEEKHKNFPSFFSENGLGQDIIQVTNAEPDVCLEVFYALYHALWPQIEKQSDISFKDAWIRFIGGAVTKGSLCPPEKLIAERRIRDIKRILFEPEGEALIFHDLDEAVNSIRDLKQKIDAFPRQILSRNEITASLNLIQDFYLRFRDQLISCVRVINEKEQMNVPFMSECDALEDLLEPKAVMMGDIFPHHWAYRIPRNRARKLLSLDMYGRNLKNNNINDPSNHRVIALPEKASDPLVFFKANGNPPIQPEKEYMVDSLYRHLQIPVPETALLILTNVFDTNPEYLYGVQASEAVLGEPSLKACQDPETIFDQEAYALQVVGAFLTNPSDGSFKNFKYSPAYETLISIDNDEVFKPELGGKNEEKTVTVKSVLYLLDKMDLPFPESLKTFLTTLDPHLTVFTWLQDLSNKNNEYNLLFQKLAFQKTRCIYENLLPQSETPSLLVSLQEKVCVDADLHGEAFEPKILVSGCLLNSLMDKLQMMEKTLLNNRSITVQALFEEIYPILGKYYRKLRFEFENPEEALEAIWGAKKNGIDYSEISSLFDPEEFSSLLENKSELDEIVLIPETFFEEFQDNLKSRDSVLDRFIKRHSERFKKNALNLRTALKEIQFLSDKRIINNSKSPRDVVDFCHSLSKLIDKNHYLIEEIISVFSNLPHPELRWLFTLEKQFLRIDRPFPENLIPFSLMANSVFMKERRFILTESESQYLFDQQENIKKHPSLTGRSRVTFFPENEPVFYLKQYPEWPGYEFASTLFMRLLGVQYLPYQDLVIFKNYPVLLTQKVSGYPVFRIWHDPKAFHNLDPVQTGLLIISAMLLNPEDGKEDNFILTADGKYLIPIDNDHCFLPSFFQKEGSFWNAFTVNTALQTKTLLFCLDEMYMHIPSEVKQQILLLDFDKLLPQWMAELDKLENQFGNLIDQNQRRHFLEQGTVMRIPFYKQFIQNLHWKAHKIQDILKTKFRPTPFDLLKAVEPFAAKCYEKSFKQGKNLKARFKAVTDELYTKTANDETRVSILNTRTMMNIVNISKEELQKDAAFQRMGPVDALDFLNQLIEERSERTKKEQEMLCELDESTQEKKWFSLFGDSPVESSLKAFLADPKEGLSLRGSKLIVSGKLVELFAQTPDKGARIRFLSLTESPLLTEKEIKILALECPNLEYLNVSGCVKLQQICTVEGEWPLLNRLEAQDCLNLEKLVSSSPIKILRIRTVDKAEISVEKAILDILVVNKRNRFDISLKSGYFQVKHWGRTVSSENYIQDLSSESSILEDCFKSLQISTGTYSLSSAQDFVVFVTFIYLERSEINIENIQKMLSLKLVNLKKLCLDGKIETNLLEYLIKADWPKLSHFSSGLIPDEGIQILIQANWPLLEHLSLRSGTITEEAVEAISIRSKWPKLKNLTLSYPNEMMNTHIKILCQGNWIHLETLSLSDKSLSNKNCLNFILNANWLKLSKILLNSTGHSFSKNLLHKNWPLLEELDLRNSQITPNEIDLIVQRSNWPQLKRLNLDWNKEICDKGIKILSQGDWPLLETLSIRNINITGVGVEAIVTLSNWPKLKHLNLSYNSEIDDKGLETLLKGNWPLLETLNLRGMKVTKKSLFNLILSSNWLNLKEINHDKSSENFVQNLIQSNWPFLQELDLCASEITQNEIEQIIMKTNWPQLKRINLFWNPCICDEGIKTLSQGNWPLLETLDISNTTITAAGIEALVTQSNWPNLKCLKLYENSKIGDKGLETLLKANWPLLETLDLHNTKITGVGVEAIVTGSNWPKLKDLNLSGNSEIDDKGLETLLKGDWPLLETLDLKWTNTTKRNLLNFSRKIPWLHLKEIKFDTFKNFDQILLKRNWPLVKEVDLWNSEISTKEIELIVYRYNWSQLKRLNLSTNKKICDEGFKTLSQGNWPLLETLNLCHLEITGVGVEAIATLSNWPKLKHLDLSYNLNLGDGGSETLWKGNWPLLETFGLECTGVTKKGLLNLILNLSWPNLKEIKFSRYDKDFAQSLFQSNWPFFKELDLQNLEITQNEIELIVMKPNWPLLKTLNLSCNEKICDEGIKTLSQGAWPLLETLDIQKINITTVGVEAIVNLSNWPKLKSLNLSENSKIGDKGLDILLKANWPLLETLGIGKTNITGVGIEALITGSNWPKLKDLNLSGNSEIDDNGFEILLNGDWPLLETLDLRWTNITKRGLLNFCWKITWLNLKKFAWNWKGGRFARQWIEDNFAEGLLPRNWPLLEKLDLRDSQVTKKEIEIIVNKYKWPQLKHIDLSGNSGIGDEALHILSRGNWLGLETLNLEGIKITMRGLLSFLLNANWPNFKEVKALDNLTKCISEIFIKKDLSRVQRLVLNNFNIRLPEIESIIKRNKYKCPQLKYLNLSDNHIFGKGKISILVVTECPLLEQLHLENTQIGPEGIKEIVKRSKWPLLKHLNISKNDIFDEGISVLTSADWPLLEVLNLSDTKLSLKRSEALVNPPKWLQVKVLNISDNDISEEGLEVLALKEWSLLEDLNLRNINITEKGIEVLVNQMKLPNLKKLDISKNAIFDEGLEILASGSWPLFQHLVYYETKVTEKGHIFLLEHFKWPDLSHLEHSNSESFYNFNKDPEEWSPSEIILALAPMHCETLSGSEEPCLVSILDLGWLNSKKICLSVDYGELKGKIIMLPREKLDQFDTMNLSLETPSLQFIKLPSSLKTLDLSENNLDETKLENLVRKNCPPIESLCIYGNTRSKTRGIEILTQQSNWNNLKRLGIFNNTLGSQELEILVSADWQQLEELNLLRNGFEAQQVEILVSKSSWPNLKKLDISGNGLKDEGSEILACGKWELLEELTLMDIQISTKGIEALMNKSNWPNLKKLNISGNRFKDEGLEVLACRKWELLEELILIDIEISAKGIEALVEKSNWPNLKKLNISGNGLKDEGLEALLYGKWPLLEKLYLMGSEITSKGVESIVEKSNWPNLKVLDLSGNQNISGDLALVLRKWPFLETLYVCLTKITLKEVEVLANEPSWANLKEICLWEQGSHFDEICAIQKFIAENWPKIKVTITAYRELLFSGFYGPQWRWIQPI